MKKPINRIIFCAIIIIGVWAGIASAESVNLPQTGQTKCYDAEGAEITCAGTGQDGEKQAGMPWPNPRFTAGTGAEADCMIDNLTGLMWPKNGNLAGGKKTWDDAIDYANNLTLCGHSDWRLPNINELESLANADETNTAAWLNAQGFTNVQSNLYWSSTAVAYSMNFAWFVHMSNGLVKYYYKTSNYYVWPVRTGQQPGNSAISLPKTGQTVTWRAGDDGDLEKGIPWPSPRFTVQGACVTDNLTGLMWPKDGNLAGGKKTWDDAIDYANNLTLCGHSDWRLPNRKELFSLIDYGNQEPALPSGRPFANVQSNFYWSSTTYAYTGSAWIVDLWSGVVNYDYKGYNGYVWPVRAGQSGSFDNLTISISGTGSGTVTSSPSGISCGSTCSASFASGTVVTLTAVADASANSAFTGWSGACTGTSTTCTVTMDASKNVTAQFSKPAQSIQISLTSGWNFISFPNLPTDKSVTKVFADVSSNVRIIWGYDNQNKKWQVYKPKVQGSMFNVIENIESGKGYWVYMDASGKIDMTGWTASTASIPLYPGWNLIGYNGNDGTINPPSGWVIIWGWEKGLWYAKHSTLNDLSALPLNSLSKGKAYWIKMTEAATDWTQQ